MARRDEFDDAAFAYWLAVLAVADECARLLDEWERERGEDAAIALGLMAATVAAMIVGAWA